MFTSFFKCYFPKRKRQDLNEYIIIPDFVVLYTGIFKAPDAKITFHTIKYENYFR